MAGKTIISTSLSSGVILNSSTYGSPLTVTGTINVSPSDAIFYQGGTGTNWTIANRGVIEASNHGIALEFTTSVASGSVINSNGGTINGATSGIYVYGYGQ